MKKKITTLEGLEKEQERLTLMMKVTQQEFARNLGTNRKQLTEFFLKNVALPMGALGLGAAITKKVTANKTENTNVSTSTSESNSAIILKKLLPIGLDLLQTYFMQKQKEKFKNIANQDTVQS